MTSCTCASKEEDTINDDTNDDTDDDDTDDDDAADDDVAEDWCVYTIDSIGGYTSIAGDWIKHWSRKVNSKDDMNRLTMDTIAKAKYITIKTYQPKREGAAPVVQISFYAQLDKELSNVVVIHLEGVRSGKIVGSWPGRDVEKTFKNKNKKGEHVWLKIKEKVF